MFVSVGNLDILKWEFIGNESVLEAASSGHSRNCSWWTGRSNVKHTATTFDYQCNYEWEIFQNSHYYIWLSSYPSDRYAVSGKTNNEIQQKHWLNPSVPASSLWQPIRCKWVRSWTLPPVGQQKTQTERKTYFIVLKDQKKFWQTR